MPVVLELTRKCTSSFMEKSLKVIKSLREYLKILKKSLKMLGFFFFLLSTTHLIWYLKKHSLRRQPEMHDTVQISSLQSMAELLGMLEKSPGTRAVRNHASGKISIYYRDI